MKLKKSQSFHVDPNWVREQRIQEALRDPEQAGVAPDSAQVGMIRFEWGNLKWKELRKSPGFEQRLAEDVDKTSYHSYVGPAEIDLPPSDDTKLMRIEIRVANVILKNRIDAWIYFFPSREISTPAGELTIPNYYNFKYYAGVYNQSMIMSPLKAVLPILSGTHYFYPFDKFRAQLTIDVIDMRDETVLPVKIDVIVSTPSLWFEILRTDNDINLPPDENIYKLDIGITRPVFVVIFCLFVVALMWALSLAIFSLAISITVFSSHRPGVPYLGLGLACLFALPNLRNTQPGVPPLGVLIDVFGFFWNMILVALSANAILLC